jgi:hypothetical protein
MPLVARTRARAALRAYAGSCWLKRVGLIGASAGYPRLSCLRGATVQCHAPPERHEFPH